MSASHVFQNFSQCFIGCHLELIRWCTWHPTSLKALGTGKNNTGVVGQSIFEIVVVRKHVLYPFHLAQN